MSSFKNTYRSDSKCFFFTHGTKETLLWLLTDSNLHFDGQILEQSGQKQNNALGCIIS